MSSKKQRKKVPSRGERKTKPEVPVEPEPASKLPAWMRQDFERGRTVARAMQVMTDGAEAVG